MVVGLIVPGSVEV